MLQSISWNQYISSIILLLVCYYGYVGYKFYRWELLGLIGIKKIEAGVSTISIEDFKEKLVSENHEDYLPKAAAGKTLQSIKDEIAACLAGTANSLYSKTDLLNALQAIVTKYPAATVAGNSNSLHQFILSETEAVHPGVLSAEDVNRLLVF